MTKKKITGLYFGSFNPIHIGHLIIANHMIEYGGMDEVWFVVSPQNPLKKQSGLLEDNHRLALVNVAIEDDPRFKVCKVEFDLPKPSYTMTTLTVLDEKYPGRNFGLIMGSDNLTHIDKWKNYEMILKDYRVFVYPRPESDGGKFRNHPSVTWVDAPLIQISSTFIRESIRLKKCTRYLLPEKVFLYISEMHFYEKTGRVTGVR